MRAYLAGPRTGIGGYNRHEFEMATGYLRNRGHEIISPVELDEPDDGMPWDGDGAALPEEQYLRGLSKCIATMCGVNDAGKGIDAVVVLEGWEASRGALLEVHIASELGKPILQYPELHPARPSKHPASTRFHAIISGLSELHDRKQQDYGSDTDPFANVRASEDFGIPGWIGTAMRANDKMKRLQTAARQLLTRGHVHLANEGVIDAFDDLGVYAVIGRVLYEESVEGS